MTQFYPQFRPFSRKKKSILQKFFLLSIAVHVRLRSLLRLRNIKVYTDVDAIHMLYSGCPPRRLDIIQLLMLTDYPHILMDKPWYKFYMCDKYHYYSGLSIYPSTRLKPNAQSSCK